MDAALEVARAAFVQKFQCAPRFNEPLLFDPDQPTPQPLVALIPLAVTFAHAFDAEPARVARRVFGQAGLTAWRERDAKAWDLEL